MEKVEEKTRIIEAPLRVIRERVRVEIPREEYLGNLAPEDKANVEAISRGLKSKENPVRGRLVAAGSSLERSNYFDIDLRLLTERGCSVNAVNQRATTAIKKLKRFDIEKGQVRDEGGDPKDCLYLQPKGKGRTIHLILSTVKDVPAADDLAFNKLVRQKFSQVCRF